MAQLKEARSGSRRASERDPALLGQLIRDVHMAFRAAVDEALRPQGLSLRQVAVLASLKRSPGQSNADLARGASMTPQSMVEVVRGLEGAALVGRRPHPGGGRALQAQLTPAGVAALTAGRAVIAQTESKLLSGLSMGERRQLRHLLERALALLRPQRS